MIKNIISAHPWYGSFNKAIMDMTKKTKEEIKDYQGIVLNKGNFDPTLTEKDLSLFS